MKRVLLFIFALGALLSACTVQASPSFTAAPSATVAPSVETPLPTEPPLPTPTATPLPLLQLKKGPYLILTGKADEMKVCWQPASPAEATLNWNSEDFSSQGSVQVPAQGVDDLSCAILTGLTPAARYQYSLQIQGAAFASNFVSRKAEDDPDLTFWVYGDSETGQTVHDALDAAILADIKADPSGQTLLFSAGDIMENASEQSLQENEFSPEYAASRQILSMLPVVNVMGNHDGTKLFLKYFPYPYTDSFDWSFDDGPVHFVIIDQYYGGDETAPRWQWLRNDLAASTKKWKIILLHEPGWSAGPHPNNVDVQQIIHPIAVKYGVAMVLAGHNHYYARAEVGGIEYITTGGAGTLLYDPEYGFPHVVVKVKEHHYLKIQASANQLILSALTSQGKMIDTFTLKK